MSLQTFAQFEKEPDIFAIQTNIEQLLNFQDAELSTQLPFDLMQKTLEKHCPMQSITKSKNKLQTILPSRSETLASQRKPFQIQADYKQIVQLSREIPQKSYESFCMQKYFFLSLLKQMHQDFFSFLNYHPHHPPSKKVLSILKQQKTTHKT